MQVDNSKDPHLLSAVKGAIAHEFGDISENEFCNKIFVLGIDVWGNFVPALNALLTFAVQKGYDEILYASPEVDVTPAVIYCLQSQLTRGT